MLEDFLTEKEVEELKKAGNELTQNIPDESHRALFSTIDTFQVFITLNFHIRLDTIQYSFYCTMHHICHVLNYCPTFKDIMSICHPSLIYKNKNRKRKLLPKNEEITR